MQHSHSELELVILGVGAGATSVYHGDASSAFLLRVSGSPRLLLDAGYGTVQAALAAGGIPDDVFISHNHSDHAGVGKSNGKGTCSMAAVLVMLVRLCHWRLAHTSRAARRRTAGATGCGAAAWPPTATAR